MKRLGITVLLFAAAICAPAAQQKKAAASEATTLPKTAVKNENGTYSYTDKQGKKWIYTVTPFGVTRSSEPGPGAQSSPIKATDKGDTVQFERITPFGKSTWEKKKADLTDDERQILEAQNQPRTAKPEAKKPDAK